MCVWTISSNMTYICIVLYSRPQSITPMIKISIIIYHKEQFTIGKKVQNSLQPGLSSYLCKQNTPNFSFTRFLFTWVWSYTVQIFEKILLFQNHCLKERIYRVKENLGEIYYTGPPSKFLVLILWMVTLSSCLIWQIISFILLVNEYGCVYA